MPPTDHIVKSFDEELQRLNRTIAQMGGLAEQQIEQAVDALVRRDVELAQQVRAADKRIDEYERQVVADTTRMLALRQPMAADLRAVLSGIKIAGDLERIGDYAKNIAKRAVVLAASPSVQPTAGVQRMGRLVQEILREILDAFAERDAERAVAAWARDEELDDLYTALFRETLTYMMEDPRTITPCTHILFVAKNIERIGDHATNVAETIYFMVKGQHLELERPKGDRSSIYAPEPKNGRDGT